MLQSISMNKHVYNNLALNVLRQYDIDSKSLTFIRHNENLIMKVVSEDSEGYVLRMHQSRDGFTALAKPSVESTQSEMVLIDAICRYADIPLQRPLKTKDGNWIAMYCDQATGCQHHATMLTWLDGQTLNTMDAMDATMAFKCGQMVAKLHDFAQCWTSPLGFQRIMYDHDHQDYVSRRLRSAIDQGLMSRAQYKTIIDGAETIKAYMRELDDKDDAKGIIHADMSIGNIIYHKGQGAPIDFGLSGFGYFYYDIGAFAGGLKADLRQHALLGYRSIRPFIEKDMKYLEAFFVQSILFCMGLFVDDPTWAAWFKRRTQPICDDYIIPLIEGKPFFDRI